MNLSTTEADWLDACEDALARSAARRVVEHAPPGSGPFELWRAQFQRSFQELAAAVRLDQPALFALHLQWLRSAFVTRGAGAEGFQQALQGLESTVKEDLPDTVRRAVERVISGAKTELDRPAGTGALAELHAQPSSGEHAPLASAYLLALLEGDRGRAADLVVQAAQQGRIDVRSAYLEVLVPTMREIGKLWFVGDASVAEEHFCTLVTQDVMTRLRGLVPVVPRNGRTVVAASVRGCAHDLGVRMVADFFEFDGWRSVVLGADVPTDALVDAARTYDASILLLSATLVSQHRAVEEVARALRATAGLESLKVLLGGCAFAACQESARTLGADAAVADAPEALRWAQQLFGSGAN